MLYSIVFNAHCCRHVNCTHLKSSDSDYCIVVYEMNAASFERHLQKHLQKKDLLFGFENCWCVRVEVLYTNIYINKTIVLL